MKSSAKDDVRSKFHEVKDKAKEVVGKVSDNPNLEAEGTGESIGGKVKDQVGTLKKVWGA